MVGALAKALARAGHRVGVVTPLYAGIRERFPELKRSWICRWNSRWAPSAFAARSGRWSRSRG